MLVETNVRSIAKSVSWRAISTTETFLISWLITGHIGVAGGIASIQAIASTFLYWLHERVWYKIKWS